MYSVDFLSLLAFSYFPYGVDGVLAGSATVFFAYIGFDSVASTAEEVGCCYQVPTSFYFH